MSAPTSQGFSTTFEMHQWNASGTTFGDGLAFTIAAVDPGNPLAPASTGPTGGALGYSALRTGGLSGLQHAYLGFGFDIFGNFSNTAYEGSNCTDPAYIGGTGVKVPGQAVVRGPGQGVVGYCALNSTATNTSSPKVAMHGSTRANSTIKVAIAINPTSSDLVDQNGLTIPAGQYILQFTPIGGTLRTLSGALPVVSPTFYGAGTSSWITAAGIPKQLVFGVTASTGSVFDNHEITNALLYSLTPVPQLSVAQTSYSDPAPVAGSPVTYSVTSGVLPGPVELSPITVTATLPTGVSPISAAGSGWVCAAPSGQQITCTDSNAPFAAGSTLPALFVQGIVTTSGLTAAGIAASTVMTSGSPDRAGGSVECGDSCVAQHPAERRDHCPGERSEGGWELGRDQRHERVVGDHGADRHGGGARCRHGHRPRSLRGQRRSDRLFHDQRHHPCHLVDARPCLGCRAGAGRHVRGGQLGHLRVYELADRPDSDCRGRHHERDGELDGALGQRRLRGHRLPGHPDPGRRARYDGERERLDLDQGVHRS